MKKGEKGRETAFKFCFIYFGFKKFANYLFSVMHKIIMCLYIRELRNVIRIKIKNFV